MPSPEIYDYMFKLTSNPDGSYTIVSVENEDKTFSELKATGRFGEPLLHNAFFITVNKNRDFNENQSIFFRFRSRESLVDEFSPRLNFSFVNEGASVLDISLVSQTPERDVDFINKLSEMFLAQNLVKKNDAARKNASGFGLHFLANSPPPPALPGLIVLMLKSLLSLSCFLLVAWLLRRGERRYLVEVQAILCARPRTPQQREHCATEGVRSAIGTFRQRRAAVRAARKSGGRRQVRRLKRERAAHLDDLQALAAAGLGPPCRSE